MNRFSQANTPFIALLSYDEPKKDIVCEISEAEKLGLKFKFNAKFKGKISYKFKKFPLKFKIYHKAFKKVQDVMKNSDLIDCSLFSYKTRKFRNFKILKSDVNYERKFLDRNALDEIFAQRGANDDVLIGKNGILTDTTIANIAILQNDIWITPKNHLLKGTIRQRLLNNSFLIERNFGIKELLSAQSFAILNAMIDFLEIKNAKFEIY